MNQQAQIHDDAGRQLLDTIDNLRRLARSSDEISLPCIVVIGQQSSGKSSVLRALSNIPFPVAQGPCTQFPIEIICRRNEHSSTTASIEPFERNEAGQTQREAFKQKWSRKKIENEADFREVVEEAAQAMDLTNNSSITRDKLRLEFSGPGQDHLTMIDLPGLVSTNSPQNPKQKDQIDELVRSYLREKHTIILTIAHGGSDRANSRVFDFIEEFSAQMLGVITAPDMIPWNSPHGGAIRKLALNQGDDHVKYGWHFLRGLKPSEIEENKSREDVEQEFIASLANDPHWSQISHVPRGVDDLRKKLAHLLIDCISVNLPGIQQSLAKARDDCKRGLHALGDERSTPSAQKEYLKQKARLLAERIADSLHGNSRAIGTELTRDTIRNKVRNANEKFAKSMQEKGHTWHAVDTDKTSNQNTLQDPIETLLSDSDEPHVMEFGTLCGYFANSVYQYPGRSLRGTFDPGWVGFFFLERSRKWKDLVTEHAESTCDLVKDELQNILKVCVGEETSLRLMEHVFEPNIEDRREQLKRKMQELLSPYLTQYPATLNQQYEAGLLEADKDLMTTSSKLDMRWRVGLHVYLCVVKYYDVAINVLMDNVQNLAIENVLLGGLQDVLRPEDVVGMSEERIAKLVSESDEVTKTRTVLTENLKSYEQGLRQIAKHWPRMPLSLGHASIRPNPRLQIIPQTSPLKPTSIKPSGEEKEEKL